MQTKLVEKRIKTGIYDFKTEAMIIDTDTTGRIMIVEGWGGDDINGYCYRWKHGLAIQLKADDTFDTFDGDWNDTCSHWEAIIHGYDPGRTVKEWPGYAIAGIAKRHA